MSKIILDVLSGVIPERPPVWLMRQAGRYLPEYREVRATARNFIDFCLTPEKATAVTLQPIERFGFDAAILFADILLVPMALGRRVWFETGEGPKLDPLSAEDIAGMSVGDVETILGPVGETVARLSKQLPGETTLIGFAGSPWTVATYMIEGGGSKDRWNARRLYWEHPEAMQRLLDLLSEATIRYLVMQARAGADVLKLFDSWAEGLPPPMFEDLVIRPTRKIVDGVRAAGIDVPIIGFPKGAGPNYLGYADRAGVTALALDHSLNTEWAVSELPSGMPLQGQLDPAVLRAGGHALDGEVDRIISAYSGRPHIFNLGHGITPDVPIENVQRLVKRIKGH
ncbi:uroporphyrinogen decarboxylase [Hyphobacterium sp. HN65]|uniref:Uroporphyrinogen decarboxylase n=1 Tax=Hyphobacterium lacteum TaxID=3116575 RepID=A0ABU7LSR7_9PROT|nr:uroporphyrinogen decarboxylase [Hyphobacterium sp. HN65]MEE2526629.1 uroporphyrinogen decarboxylase [Hyphobacterium sp. HN65]